MMRGTMNHAYTVCILLILSFSVFQVSSTALNERRGINGGIGCAACTIITGIFSQVAEINNQTITNVTLEACDHLPLPIKTVCRDTVLAFKPVLEFLIERRLVTPDTFCYGLNFCHKDDGEKMCYLFPEPEKMHLVEKSMSFIEKQSKPFLQKWFLNSLRNEAYNPCHLPIVRDICDLIARNFMNMEPLSDFDGDHFSSSEIWRGSHWRGKDCDDHDSSIYPGRQPNHEDVTVDSNCNGIWGKDKTTGIPWETKLCGGQNSSLSRGLVMLGDSVGAHFHFPEVWFNPLLIHMDTFFTNITQPVLDELDWPEYSFSTGYQNISLPILIQGKTDSIYLRLRERNLCNHRDYQNVCRNGVNSYDLLKYAKNIARNPKDKPATILLGVFGNDVCNSFPDTLPSMTTPTEFYKNIKSAIDHLSSTLPPNSHIVLIGLVDGGFIYNALVNRLHPIGQYHRNVKYRNVFQWLECMQISPCIGWMSSNDTIRKLTSKRAMELSEVLRDIAHKHSSPNVNVYYVDNPLYKVLSDWKKKGGEIWQLIDAVDGFHPNQVAQPLIANVLWKYLEKYAPAAIGDENLQNSEIRRMFHDQGGH